MTDHRTIKRENANNDPQGLSSLFGSFGGGQQQGSIGNLVGGLLGGEVKVGIIDFIIKIVGGALTFGLLIIALRRKFERKYTR
jgi:hypothetical protein